MLCDVYLDGNMCLIITASIHPQVLISIATPVDLTDRESLIKAANTSLSSKVVSQYSSLLSPIAVDCVLRAMDPKRPGMYVASTHTTYEKRSC